MHASSSSSAPLARQPMFWAGAAFAAGIFAGAFAWRPPLWWTLATVVALLAAWLLRRRALAAYALGLAGLFAAGALSIQLRSAEQAPDLARFTDGREVTVTAHVVRDGRMRSGSGGRTRQSLDVETEFIETAGDRTEVRTGIRLTIYAAPPSADEYEGEPLHTPLLAYGTRIRFTTRLREPRNFGNPSAFDYRGYLRGRGIVAQGSTRTDRLELLDGKGGTRMGRARSEARRALLERIERLWPGPTGALLATMVIGERTALDRQIRTDFQRTGAYHVLVVSGLHVAILAFVVFWTARRLRLGDAAATLATIALATAYAWVTDAGAPVNRAALMLALYLGARLLYRARAPLNALGIAALGMLLLEPRALFDASFQLTFLAVLAIAGIALPLLERISLPYRRALRHLDSIDYDISLPPRLAQLRLDLRLVAERLARFTGERAARWLLARAALAGLWLFDLLLVSAVMQIALALPMAWYFHRASILAVGANAVIVPLTSALIPAAMLTIALSFLWEAGAAVAASAVATLVTFTLDLVARIGSTATADLRVATPTFAMCAAAAAVFAAAVIAVRMRRSVAAATVALLAVTAAWIAFAPPTPQVRPGVLEITALDVGQGDALLVVTPEGKTLLIDAGGAVGGWESDFDFGEDVVSPYLWSRGITRLDAVALTHAHADHIGGMPQALANFRPRELWVGVNPEIRASRALERRAQELGVGLKRLRQGDAFAFGGAQIQVLAPPRDWTTMPRPRNDDSLALRIAHGNTSALLAGDAERRIEKVIAAQQPRADLLKVAHHGSASSTTRELLAAAQPQFAVISVGARSPFGHPRDEVLERLAQARVVTYRTDTHGATTFYLDGSMVTARPQALR